MERAKPSSSVGGRQRMSKMWKARNSSINITFRNVEETPKEAQNWSWPSGGCRNDSEQTGQAAHAVTVSVELAASAILAAGTG